ncbi:MAG: ABC transporter permease subunit [Candidatus Wenzhouxiangella sp. M2_3B_020]
MSSTPDQADGRKSFLPSVDAMARRRRRRYVADSAAGWLVRAGGGGVVVALALIFVYLFSEVVPILRGASVDEANSFVAPARPEAPAAILALERYDEVGIRHAAGGVLTYFTLEDGALLERVDMNVPDGVEVTSLAAGEPRSRRVAYGLSDGSAIVVDHETELEFEDGERSVVPAPAFPLGEAPIVVDDRGRALRSLAVQKHRDGDTGIVAQTEDGRLVFVRFTTTTSFLTGETEIEREAWTLPRPPRPVSHLQLTANLWSLLGIDGDGRLLYWDLSDPDAAILRDQASAVNDGETVTAMRMLNGTFSTVVGTSRGRISQWFLVRDERAAPGDNIFRLSRVREFETHPGAITAIQPEYNRKGFAAVDDTGALGLHYGTSARTLYLRPVSDAPLRAVGISPVDDLLIVENDSGRITRFEVWNEHPEVSLKALWGKVWYEGRQDPEYVWQASSGADSFEPKYSMVPLTVGTLKAALFAMLFAMPLAIAGAVYTAYFMAPTLRGYVKPTIEVMEALPTVILGFLAGLWLAPFLENHIPAVFTVLVGLPLSFLAVAYAFSRLPQSLRASVPPGWEAVILLPVIALLVWGLVELSPLIEVWFFDGSMRQWFTDIGITYDQRNALVVGIAMGFAVIPTIFSIAEDAVFTVPKHLTQGSLALGATPWQTLTRVVLLTASPGIFSAVMIGFGRAVGETMIVLMATGNSPVVNFNIFEGMRTLSANIAVELPETAVDSTHYRILFLAGLVLFVITFAVNTIAELVRQRLRQRYSSL